MPPASFSKCALEGNILTQNTQKRREIKKRLVENSISPFPSINMTSYRSVSYGSSSSANSYGHGLPQPAPVAREAISYFVPGYGISRHVIMHRIAYFIGHNYTIRPFTYQQREGYLLTHDGPPLTRSQIEDLKDLSKQFEEREAEKMRNRSAALSSEGHFLNRPIPVQQRHSYLSDPDDYSAYGRSNW